MDQDQTWYRGRCGPAHIVSNGTQFLIPQRRTPQFSAHVSDVAKQLHGVASGYQIPLGKKVGLGQGVR